MTEISSSKMRPWKEAVERDLNSVKGVCLDIDETLSTRGKLTSEAYESLWRLKNAGYFVVPVTGRPAGWCDLIARFWPVDAVVGENGAFTFYVEKGVRKRITTPGAKSDAKKLTAALGDKIRSRFPSAVWASDQAYREYDLAIDICEDVPHWSKTDIDSLLELCQKEGAHAKLSSIHVNAWFGDYDKKSGLQHWLNQGAPGIDQKTAPSWGEWLFIGDSPNDEPLFGAFKHSVGVANLAVYQDRLKTPPTWITERESGAGFTEMADKLCSLRGK